MSDQFHVGQQVVCIGNFDFSDRPVEEAEAGVVWPKLHHIYTVRAVRKVMTYTGSVVALHLREIRNPVLPYLGGADEAEIAFEVRSFRPIVSRRTDIAVFERLLTPSRVREDA